MSFSAAVARRQPTLVRVAVGALVAAAVFGLLRALTTVVLYDDLLRSVIDNSNLLKGTSLEESRSLAEELAPSYRVIALIGGALFGLLLLGCAVGVLRRLGWCRWVGVAVCVLTVLAGLVVLVQPSIAIVTTFGLLTALAAAVALVALLTPPVGAWVSGREPR